MRALHVARNIDVAALDTGRRGLRQRQTSLEAGSAPKGSFLVLRAQSLATTPPPQRHALAPHPLCEVAALDTETPRVAAVIAVGGACDSVKGRS